MLATIGPPWVVSFPTGLHRRFLLGLPPGASYLSICRTEAAPSIGAIDQLRAPLAHDVGIAEVHVEVKVVELPTGPIGAGIGTDLNQITVWKNHEVFVWRHVPSGRASQYCRPDANDRGCNCESN